MQLKFIKIIFKNLTLRQVCFWKTWKSPKVPHGSAEHTFSITHLNDVKIQHGKHTVPQFKSSPR